MDDHLKLVNIEYKAKRDSLRLGSPTMHVMREGWYEAGRRERASGGRRAFQAKTIVLTPDHQSPVAVRAELLNIVELED